MRYPSRHPNRQTKTKKYSKAMKRNYEAPLVKVVEVQPEGLLMLSTTIDSADDKLGAEVKGEFGSDFNSGSTGNAGKSIWDDQW